MIEYDNFLVFSDMNDLLINTSLSFNNYRYYKDNLIHTNGKTFPLGLKLECDFGYDYEYYEYNIESIIKYIEYKIKCYEEKIKDSKEAKNQIFVIIGEKNVITKK